MSAHKSIPSSSLSAADAAFLYLERKDIPLHIASVCIFDGPIPFKQFVASTKSKLALVPLYKKIPVVPAWSLEFPTWRDDPDFDIRRHIFQVTLDAPGGEAELEALAAKLLSQVLDRNKPLWEMHVVDGLQDGRGAIIWRVHHSLCDGVSAADLMTKILDPSPEVSLKPRRVRVQPPKAKPAESDFIKGISAAVTTALGSLVALEASLLDFAQGALEGKDKTALNGLMGILPEYAASVERLPFNKPCTGTRKFCWAEISMADVHRIREAQGGTVNDVVLSVLARALARYVKVHGQSVVNRFVRLVCPVSLRAGEHNGDLGNQISFLPRALPLDVRGPVEMLHAVTHRTEMLKKSGALGLVGLAAKWFVTVPPPIQALFWRNIPDFILPLPLFNMICTNVMGSTVPLYAAGRKMIAAYPQVPTGYDLGIGLAVHSYDGKLFFGLIADTQAAPDVNRFRDFLVASFEELLHSATSKKARRAPKTSRHTKEKKREPKPAEPVPAAASEAPSEQAPTGEPSAPPVARAVQAA
ncbi:MAG TPA: wax ester/triacylglycerol synthase family O-acyltransferase [Terriglobales bacterium]|nr:wax ester/triacylglycerol synthase family O-acyltransferase [Terriglobales bacterium]